MLKGYFTDSGYMGFCPFKNKYILFACESDYLDYVKENNYEI